MNLRLSILLLLALSKAVFARPVTNSIHRQSTSIPWRKYLPTLGALGIVGSLVGLIFLGTKADEAYKSAKVVTESEANARYSTLTPDTREYLLQRLEFIGEKNLPQWQKDDIAEDDLLHGWPPAEMPDTHGMDRSTRRELTLAYQNFQKAMGKVEIAQELKDKAFNTAVQAGNKHKEAQYHAALIAATEWKDAYEKAKEQISEVDRTRY